MIKYLILDLGLDHEITICNILIFFLYVLLNTSVIPYAYLNVTSNLFCEKEKVYNASLFFSQVVKVTEVLIILPKEPVTEYRTQKFPRCQFASSSTLYLSWKISYPLNKIKIQTICLDRNPKSVEISVVMLDNDWPAYMYFRWFLFK